MQFLPEHTYHVYNQGNNQAPIFFDREDYLLFVEKMRKALMPNASILAWCLMPNHFHWLIQVNEDYEVLHDPNQMTRKLNPLNKDIGTLLSSYSQLINKKYNRTGSLFRKRTKAKSLSEDRNGSRNQGINCFLYIHQNPLKACLVDNMEEWEFSSFRDYLGIRNGDLCNQALAKELFKLPVKPNEFHKLSLKTIPDHITKKLF
ncbi:transposase [Gracilimonas sp.]|uniref:transposase n=1 Tax=Gracilimonas sp. TaxID=1974203 RepID=UPI0028726FC3|nr:transposase [Gracilimonas sp.]